MMEEDYIMRIIHEMVRTLLKLLFNIESDKTSDEDFKDVESMKLYRRLKDLADEHKIDDAENLLFDSIDSDNLEIFKAAIMFYSYLNEKDEEFLEKGNFSRTEITEGMISVAEDYGYDSLVRTLVEK